MVITGQYHPPFNINEINERRQTINRNFDTVEQGQGQDAEKLLEPVGCGASARSGKHHLDKKAKGRAASTVESHLVCPEAWRHYHNAWDMIFDGGRRGHASWLHQ